MERIDHAWTESATLLEESLVQLRLLRPSDKSKMQRAFERLFPDSRYHAEYDLVEVDGWHQLAIVAFDEVSREGVGLAHFVRLAGEPAIAEAAVTVAEDWTDRGLARLLLDRLIEAARERRIETFRIEVLASDEAVVRRMRELPSAVSCRVTEGVMTVDVELPTEPDAALGAHGLLKLVARRAVEWMPSRTAAL